MGTVKKLVVILLAAITLLSCLPAFQEPAK